VATNAVASRATTIRDVASECDVSVTTVSHVFSGKRHVSQATREKVLATARKLGYAPNANALGLATGRSMTLGLHVPFADSELVLNPFFSSILPAMSTVALEQGYSFILLPSGPRRARTTLARLLDDRRVDGVILVDPEPEAALHLELVRRGRPFVSVGRIVGFEDEYSWVDNDVRGDCTALLDHLTEQGYERPALLGVSGGQSYVEDYDLSYRDWCRKNRCEPNVVLAQAITEQDGYEAAAIAIADSNAPDALVCIHDRLAVGTLRAAHDAGLDVPRDLGIAGSTDTLYAQHVNPRLTSVRIFPELIGETAVGALLALLAGEPPPQTRLIPTELVLRESTMRMSASD
jgi:DNA-binding LacI/PurR family transcriptional regulator